MTPMEVKADIDQLTELLFEKSLLNDQNFPCIKEISGVEKFLTFSNDTAVAAFQNDQAYRELHESYSNSRCYNFQFLDGALLQMSYRFHRDSVVQHRLNYLPSPSFEEFQNNPEVYETDHMYGDVIAREILPVPIRLDFSEIHTPVRHPRAHVTLGQFQNCRIPVICPVSPSRFLKFILSSFYHIGTTDWIGDIAPRDFSCPPTMVDVEADEIHLFWRRNI